MATDISDLPSPSNGSNSDISDLPSPKSVSLKITPAPKESKLPPLSERAGALAYGAATGLVGGLGELEKFGAYTVPEWFGLREEGSRDQYRGRETLFPTIEEARKGLSYLGIEPPSEKVKGYVSGGELIGGIAGGLPGALKGGTRALTGVPSATSEAAAQTAERLGFRVSPAQVRQDAPVSAKGSTGNAARNQAQANRLASRTTGEEVTEINPDFIRGRLRNLGNRFDDLYQGQVFNIDQNAVDAIRQIAATEGALPGVVSVPAVRQTANNIIDRFNVLANRAGARPNTFGIEGEALQRMRNDLSAAARSTTNRQDARVIYDLIDVVDGSIARNHPDVAATLNVLRPQYRSTIVLEDLLGSGGIKQGNISLDRLGTMLGSRRGAVRRAGDLDELGELGRELQLKARWESTGGADTPTGDILKKALGTTLGGAASVTGLRSRPARAAQSLLARRGISDAEKAGMLSEAGQAPGQIKEAIESE